MAEGGTVLVVGGSRGIGLAIAREFAAAGYGLMLVARGADSLAVATGEIRRDFGVPVGSVACDAASEAGQGQLAAALDGIEGGLAYAVIGLGDWHDGAAGALERAEQGALLEANVTAPLALQRRIRRLLRPGGGMLVLGSLAGFLPVPWISAYAASKGCLNASVMALRQELAPEGIGVSLLAPGVVMTDFVPRDGGSPWRWALDLVASNAATVGRAACLGLRANRAVIVPGLAWRLVWLGMSVWPTALAARMAGAVLRPRLAGSRAP